MKMISIRPMCARLLQVGFLLTCCCSSSLANAYAQDAQPIYKSKEYTVWRDRVISGTTSARVVSPGEIDVTSTSVNGGAQAPRWVLQDDISGFPQMRSNIPLIDALYNLSLSELKKDTRPDGAFNAGANWDGVWTRDVSYSIILSLAAIQPEASKASLLQKVKRDRIVQDTGTGGSWPVSSDRVTWALGAWEVYLTTGDRAWLQKIYTITENTVRDDEQVVRDPATGLYHGETTFLDWREQTYPRWMQPADIFSSEALGTNAVYYRTYQILAAMATELKQPSKEWTDKADTIRVAMVQKFWMKDRGYFGQYRYGRTWKTLSPRSDALAESLCILFDIADASQQDQILKNQPMLSYGVPTVFPDSPNTPAYHNKTVWPFVQAFWNLAAAKRENGDALTYGLASIYRQAAVFLTNKENFLSDTGSQEGTVLNSDRQLWSVAGDLAMTYRLFFGMDFASDGLHLQPVVPEAFKGTRILTNFHYRNAVLNIEVRGFGSNIHAIAVDGKRGAPFIDASTTGPHTIVIDLDGQPLKSAKMNVTNELTALETPQVKHEGATLSWKPVKKAEGYIVYRDAVQVGSVKEPRFDVPSSETYSEYQVSAEGSGGDTSFLSEPVSTGEVTTSIPVTSEASPYVTLNLTSEKNALVDWAAPSSGKYEIAFHYANGNGPVNTDNKCAIRTLFVDGKKVGSIVLPQRGANAWSDWGWSNRIAIDLSSGKHSFDLRLLSQDMNMNGTINDARIEGVSLTRLSQ